MTHSEEEKENRKKRKSDSDDNNSSSDKKKQKLLAHSKSIDSTEFAGFQGSNFLDIPGYGS